MLSKKQQDIIDSYYKISLYVLLSESEDVLNEILNYHEMNEHYEHCIGIKKAINYNKLNPLNLVLEEINK
jgi:hypothetical protein